MHMLIHRNYILIEFCLVTGSKEGVVRLVGGILIYIYVHAYPPIRVQGWRFIYTSVPHTYKGRQM